MPMLSKRKRPTLNSSFLHNDSVWHSTPVDSTALSTAPEETAEENEEEEGEGNLVSPVKRPALGEGVRGTVSVTPDVGDKDKERRSSDFHTPDNSAGPSSKSMICTPAVVANIRLDSANSEEEDLFEDMEEEQQRPDKENKEPPPKPPQQSTSTNIHISQRFGPVVIHPPSGHPYFCSILQENGFLLTLPKNHLRHEISHFRALLNKWISDSTDEFSRIDDGATKFIKAMKKYFSTKENLVHACTTTLNDGECIQPSLLSCLLGVPLAQKPLIEVVLPALSEAAFSNDQQDVDLVGTIVNQMKWLPIMVDGTSLADHLLNILEVAAINSKKHIIRLLPEIFLPEFHPYLIPKLMELFDIGTQINVTMLDCLSCLVVPEEDCLRIRRSAVDQMTNAALEDLPAYLSFLFRVGSPHAQLEEGIREMREKLEIKPKHKTPKEDILQGEILERIRFFVSVNPAITKIWIEQIKEDISIELDLQTLDLLMLLVFHEAGNKSALSTLTVLFNRPKLVNLLFDNMMQNNNQMLHDLFPTIARYLDSVLRVKNPKCHEGAASVTQKLFVGLGPVLSQHLTSNLIGVLINGHPSCRDIVLKIFKGIAEIDPPKLLYFHSYLMGALVYILKYPPRQMEALMNILAILAYMPENLQGEENSFTAEFMILLRKQITHTNPRARCFGVLGIIAAVRQLANQKDENNETKIDGLLALAWSSIENDEEACSIFFDEMIASIQFLPKTICMQFRMILKMQFQRLFTVDQASESQTLQSGKGQGELVLAPSFDANQELTRDQFIIVLEPQALQMSPLVVPSLFRVMVELERASEDGSLVEIDSVLGCPVFMPKYSAYYDQASLEHLNFNQRFHLGQYLLITLNYFRECVSAFADTEESLDLRVKVWMRLSNIVTIQRSFVKHFDSFPNLQLAYETEKHKTDDSGAGFSGALIQGRKVGAGGNKKAKKPKAVKKKKKGKAKSGKKKKRSSDDDDEEEESEAQEESDDDDNETPNVVKSSDLEEQIQPKSIGLYIRRLDSRVFQLLKSPFKPLGQPVSFPEILLNLSRATQSVATMQNIEQLIPDTLALLLAEIKKQTLDKKYNLEILSIEGLLDSLCNHIDTISKFYNYEYNSVNVTQSQEPPLHNTKVDSCVRLLITIMDLYLETVSNQEKTKQAELIDTIVMSMASRQVNSQPDEAIDEDASQGKFLSNMATYLSKFTSIVGFDDPQIAQDHVKLMKTMHDLLPRPEQMKIAIEETIKSYLCRDWKLPSGSVNFFLKTWFDVTSSPLKVVKHLEDHILEENETCVIPNSTVYKSCTKINFHTWYGAILSGLVLHVVKRGRRRGDFDDSIDLWFDGNNLWKKLVDVSMNIKKSAILIPLIRLSRMYIEAFISGGVCLMPELWNRDFEKGQSFSKTLQNCTRKIQNICEFSKVMKDNLLLRHVPFMKKSLEALVLKVREAISKKGINDGFWMGELKHRNLDGEVMDSQPFNHDSEEEESEDEDGMGVSHAGGVLPDEGDDEEMEDGNMSNEEMLVDGDEYESD